MKEKTKICQQVVSYLQGADDRDVLDAEGERLPVLCGTEFPDREDGPWSVWLDLCGDCYASYKEREAMSQSQHVTPLLQTATKTVRIQWNGKAGVYQQFAGNGTNRIALDDASFDITVSDDDYVVNYPSLIQSFMY